MKDAHREKWSPILEPMFKETEGFTMEEWKEWTGKEENAEKLSQLLRAFLEISVETTIFRSSEFKEETTK